MGTPHFAQFVPLEDNQIGFFTVYDGDFDKYIADFTKNIGQVFDLIFKFTKNAPPSPCRKHLQEFIDFAAGANRAPIGFYQAYPGLIGAGYSCSDRRQQVRSGPRAIASHERGVRQERRNETRTSRKHSDKGRRRLFPRLFGRAGTMTPIQPPAAMPALDLGDIQGFILRGYRMPMVRHFLLTVGVPARPAKFLGRLVSGDESDAPQITTAEDWHVGFEPGPGDNSADAPRRKPDYCLNVGITWPGLLALEVKDRVPTLRVQIIRRVYGRRRRASGIGGRYRASAPENWIGGFGKGDDHVLVTLHAMSPDALAAYSDRLSALFAEVDAFREIWRLRRYGVDGDARMASRFTHKVPFRLYRRHQHDHHSRRAGTVSARPSAALRPLVVRPAG